MLTRTLWTSLSVLAITLLSAGYALALGGIMGETKEQLKLKYAVTVSDPANGQVQVRFTLEDDGRLKPVERVELMIPRQDGSGSYDLTLPLGLTDKDGKRTVYFNLKTEWAKRAEIWLTTVTLDGKHVVGYERLHHRIEVAPHMKAPQQPAPAAKPAADAPAAAPAAGAPATERK